MDVFPWVARALEGSWPHTPSQYNLILLATKWLRILTFGSLGDSLQQTSRYPAGDEDDTRDFGATEPNPEIHLASGHSVMVTS